MDKFIENVMNIFQSQSWNHKAWMVVDSVGVSLSVAFFGFGFKHAVDNWAPTIILALTVISILLTVVFKAVEFYEKFIKK